MKSETERLRAYRLDLRFRHIVAVAGKALTKLRRWRQISYERKLLGSLDSRMLRDIGVSRAEAERESARPFWDDKSVAQRRRERS